MKAELDSMDLNRGSAYLRGLEPQLLPDLGFGVSLVTVGAGLCQIFSLSDPVAFTMSSLFTEIVGWNVSCD
jgi:hypothetical protein